MINYVLVYSALVITNVSNSSVDHCQDQCKGAPDLTLLVSVEVHRGRHYPAKHRHHLVIYRSWLTASSVFVIYFEALLIVTFISRCRSDLQGTKAGRLGPRPQSVRRSRPEPDTQNIWLRYTIFGGRAAVPVCTQQPTKLHKDPTTWSLTRVVSS